MRDTVAGDWRATQDVTADVWVYRRRARLLQQFLRDFHAGRRRQEWLHRRCELSRKPNNLQKNIKPRFFPALLQTFYYHCLLLQGSCRSRKLAKVRNGQGESKVTWKVRELVRNCTLLGRSVSITERIIDILPKLKFGWVAGRASGL